MQRTRHVGGALALLLVFLTALAPARAEDGVSPTTITLGQSVALTGPASELVQFGNVALRYDAYVTTARDVFRRRDPGRWRLGQYLRWVALLTDWTAGLVEGRLPLVPVAPSTHGRIVASRGDSLCGYDF